MALDAQTRLSYSSSALQTSLQLQAQAVQNTAADQSTLSSLVTQSQSAAGALQASQATNQLLALNARESMQEQQLRLTQDRAMALEAARAVAAAARASVVRAQFIGNGTQYSPQPVSFYGN
jgi:P-type conjugative transfer protein TrbJ